MSSHIAAIQTLVSLKRLALAALEAQTMGACHSFMILKFQNCFSCCWCFLPPRQQLIRCRWGQGASCLKGCFPIEIWECNVKFRHGIERWGIWRTWKERGLFSSTHCLLVKNTALQKSIRFDFTAVRHKSLHGCIENKFCWPFVRDKRTNLINVEASMIIVLL